MYSSKFRFNDFLLFGLAFPIIALSGILHGGRMLEHFHIIYLGTFFLLFLWLGGRLFSEQPHFSLKQAPVLALSLATFYGFCALQLLAFLTGAREGLTTLDPYLTYKTLPLVFVHILLFFFFLDCYRSTRTINHYFNCLFMLTSALALLGLLQDIIPNIWRKNMFFVTTINIDFYSTFFNNDHFAFFLNLILPLAVATTLWEGVTRYSWERPIATLLHITRRPLVIKIIGVFIIGITTGWTGSRSGTVAIGVAMSFTISTLLLIVWKKYPEKLPILFSILALSAMAVPLLLLFTGVPNAMKQIYWWYLNILEIVKGTSPDASYAGRMYIYKSFIPAIAHYPLFGAGIGTLLTSFTPFTPYEYGHTIGAHALSDYLELIFETGLVGFTLLIFIPLVMMAKYLVRYFKKWPEIPSSDLVLLIGSLGGLVAAGIHSATDFSLKFATPMMVFLSIAAIPFSLFLRNTEEPRRSLGFLAALPLMALVIIHGVMFELPFRAAANLKNEGIRALPQAIRLDPLNPNYRIQLLRQDIEKSDWPEEERVIQEIIRISPRARTYGDIGEMLSIKGNIDREYPARAVPYLEKACLLAPLEDKYLVNLIESQIRLARIAEDRDKDTSPYLEKIRQALERRILRTKKLNPSLQSGVKRKLTELSSPQLQKDIEDLLDKLARPTPIA